MARHESRPRIGRSLAGFLGLLVALALIAALRNQLTSEAPQPYSLSSIEDDGLRGLQLWLERLGYRVELPRAVQVSDFADADLIFLFPPVSPVGSARAAALSKWVAEGHTLAVVAASDIALETMFGVRLVRSYEAGGTTIREGQPLLADSASPVHTLPPGQPLAISTVAGQAAVRVLFDEDDSPTLTVQAMGEGVVWHLSPRHDLTNDDLRSGLGRQIVPAILRTAPAGGVIYILNGEGSWSDLDAEASGAASIDGLGQWLVRRPTGWALLLAAAATLAFLFLQGRRLGPALLVADPHRRRAAAEYVLAMARLTQRAGHRAAVARYQKARLKRRLGQAWQISPDLPDDAFVERLISQAAYPPDRLEALRRILAGLADDIAEHTLIERVAEAQAFGS